MLNLENISGSRQREFRIRGVSKAEDETLKTQHVKESEVGGLTQFIPEGNF